MVRDTTGRFQMRPHYTQDELDRECEQIIEDFLKVRHGGVTFPVSTDDLTALLEVKVEDLDLYADLSAYGDGTEGVTIFVPGGKPRVKIAQELSGNSKRENRLRTTLTHEYGHVHFHSYLFDPSLNAVMSSRQNSTVPKAGMEQVCKRDTMLEATTSDWMEWQAGHICGAILMPITYVGSLIQKKFAEDFSMLPPASSSQGIGMIEAVRMHFQVSSEAARIRLLRLNIVK